MSQNSTWDLVLQEKIQKQITDVSTINNAIKENVNDYIDEQIERILKELDSDKNFQKVLKNKVIKQITVHMDTMIAKFVKGLYLTDQ